MKKVVDMIYDDLCEPGMPMIPVTYCLLKPATLRIRNTDGSEGFVGYGIGEKFRVMKPRTIKPVANRPKLKEIQLEDGRFIVEWPDDLQCEIQRLVEESQATIPITQSRLDDIVDKVAELVKQDAKLIERNKQIISKKDVGTINPGDLGLER